jgi:hypothetical protein
MTMSLFRVRRARGIRYNPETYGLLASRKRLTRVTFVLPHNVMPPEHPERTYGALLEEVYPRMTRMSLAPLPLPERIQAEWRDDEQAFVLHADGLAGFGIVVDVEPADDEDTETHADASESAPVAAGGSDEG